MTKNIDMQKVNEELRSLGKSPSFSGTDFDNAVFGEIFKEESDITVKMLKAFESGRRSVIRKIRADNKEENTVVEMENNPILENIRILAINIDDELNAIECDTMAIDDINTLIGYLRTDMDNVPRADILGYFRDFHLRVRVLHELTRSASQSLNKNLMAANEVQKELFENAYNPDNKKSQFALQSERPVK